RVAVRRPAVPGVVVPAAAAEHAGRGPWLKRVFAPLPDVAVHVVEAQTVGLVRTDLRGPLQVWSLGRTAIRIPSIKIGGRRGQRVRRLVEIEMVRTVFWRSSPSPTSILPFCLGRQAIQPSSSPLLRI